MNNHVHFLPCSVVENDDKKIYDIQFYNETTLTSGDVSGDINYYSIDTECIARKINSISLSESVEDPSSVFAINHSDNLTLAGLSNGEAVLMNNSNIAHRYQVKEKDEEISVSKIQFINENLFAAGDNEGKVSIFDIRTNKKIISLKEQVEEITQLAHCEEHEHFLLSSSIDGSLAVYDLRKHSLYALSDCIEEEINCMQIMKGGNKVVCGTGEGNIAIFNWDWFGDYKDRIVGNQYGVLSMDKYSENIIMTGSEDGGIRVCTIYPQGVRGIIGEKGEKKKKNKEFKDIENIVINEKREIMVVTSNISYLKIFDMREVNFDEIYKDSKLNEEEEDYQQEEEEGKDEQEEEENEDEENEEDEDDEEEEEEEDEEKEEENKEGQEKKEDSNISLDEKDDDEDSDSSDSFSKKKKKKSKKLPKLGKKRQSEYIIAQERRKDFFSDL